MKKLLATVAAVLASAAIAFSASLPNVPSTGQYTEASQIVATLNALVQQLNGNVGYAPAQVVSLGSFATASGATPVTLAAQRGIVSFTGVATLTTGSVTTLTMTNSTITAASQCLTQVQSGGAAGSAPYVSTATPTAGSLAMILANGGTTATGAAQTFAISFNCS
jgi:hypothetical protein